MYVCVLPRPKIFQRLSERLSFKVQRPHAINPHKHTHVCWYLQHAHRLADFPKQLSEICQLVPIWCWSVPRFVACAGAVCLRTTGAIMLGRKMQHMRFFAAFMLGFLFNYVYTLSFSMIVRHDHVRLTCVCNGCYRINYALKGTTLRCWQQKCRQNKEYFLCYGYKVEHNIHFHIYIWSSKLVYIKTDIE